MPVFVQDNKSVLFIHIPKCGGSSFEGLMVSRGWQEVFSVRGIHVDHLRGFRCTPQHFHGQLLSQVFDPERFDTIIGIVRHPYMRVKSEYYWQRKQKITQSSPEQWWSSVQKVYLDNSFAFDNHIRPQNEFMFPSEKLQLFKLEENGVQRAISAVGASQPPCSADEVSKKWAKKSVYDDKTEAEFLKLRPQIEKFYARDMESLRY